MKAYSYTEDLHIFDGEFEADIDTEESAVQGKTVYLLPANSTLLIPPTELPENYVAVFDEDSWTIKEDYRNCIVINSNMRKIEIQDLGPLSSGQYLITEEQYQNILKDSTYYLIIDGKLIENPANKNKEINKLRQDLYNKNETVREEFKIAGVTYKGIIFDSDDEQKINLMYASSMMSDTDTIEWTGQDGISKLLCSKEDLMQIGSLIQQKISYIWQIRNPEIKSQIMNAKTIEELNAIDISYNI